MWINFRQSFKFCKLSWNELKIFPRRRNRAVSPHAQLVVGHRLSHTDRRRWRWRGRWRGARIDVRRGRRTVGDPDWPAGNFDFARRFNRLHHASAVSKFRHYDGFAWRLFGSAENFLRLASRLRDGAEDFKSRRHFSSFLASASRCKSF